MGWKVLHARDDADNDRRRDLVMRLEEKDEYRNRDEWMGRG